MKAPSSPHPPPPLEIVLWRPPPWAASPKINHTACQQQPRDILTHTSFSSSSSAYVVNSHYLARIQELNSRCGLPVTIPRAPLDTTTLSWFVAVGRAEDESRSEMVNGSVEHIEEPQGQQQTVGSLYNLTTCVEGVDSEEMGVDMPPAPFEVTTATIGVYPSVNSSSVTDVPMESNENPPTEEQPQANASAFEKEERMDVDAEVTGPVPLANEEPTPAPSSPVQLPDPSPSPSSTPPLSEGSVIEQEVPSTPQPQPQPHPPLVPLADVNDGYTLPSPPPPPSRFQSRPAAVAASTSNTTPTATRTTTTTAIRITPPPPQLLPPHANNSEQWRVGKTPGHQGSHQSKHKRRSDMLSGDEDDEAPERARARILKRPFRPPTRVTPAVAVPDTPDSLPNRSTTATASTTGSPSTPDPPSSPTKRGSPSTTTTLHRRPATVTSARARRPFKSPLTPAATPPSSSVRRRGPRAEPDAALIAQLEARTRTFKQATKYTSAADEDARLAVLVGTWRTAGREVADRLFAVIPEPGRDTEAVGRGGGGGAGAWANWGFDDGGSGGRGGFFGDGAGAGRREGGGASHTDSELDDDEVVKIVDAACAVRRYGKEPSIVDDDVYSVRPVPDDDDECRDGNASTNTPKRNWDRGAMLLRLGVDPALLGYNAEDDEWEWIDDE